MSESFSFCARILIGIRYCGEGWLRVQVDSRRETRNEAMERSQKTGNVKLLLALARWKMQFIVSRVFTFSPLMRFGTRRRSRLVTRTKGIVFKRKDLTRLSFLTSSSPLSDLFSPFVIPFPPPLRESHPRSSRFDWNYFAPRACHAFATACNKVTFVWKSWELYWGFRFIRFSSRRDFECYLVSLNCLFLSDVE